jgi:hypothetical protein
MREGYNKFKYSTEQWAWCMNYESKTGMSIDPMMDDFELGRTSFHEAARKAVRTYEDHSKDAYLSISNNIPGFEIEFEKTMKETNP